MGRQMGGIGISVSQDGENSNLTSLPGKVVEEIARQLGIRSAESRQELAASQVNLPDDTEVTITRLSTGSSLTITKLAGSDTYRLKHQNSSVDVTA